MKLLNAFSLSMIPSIPLDSGNGWGTESISVQRISLPHARQLLSPGVESAVGHADTAAILSGLLGLAVAVDRKSVTLAPGESAIVAQVVGGRLPEGTTVLPPGTEIQWFWVTRGGTQLEGIAKITDTLETLDPDDEFSRLMSSPLSRAQRSAFVGYMRQLVKRPSSDY